MPNIEITSEQAAALARGENITVEAPAKPLHNVVALSKGSRTSLYIWDGEVRPDGRIYATRYQWLTNFYGEAEDPVTCAPASPSWVTSTDAVVIAQVGA